MLSNIPLIYCTLYRHSKIQQYRQFLFHPDSPARGEFYIDHINLEVLCGNDTGKRLPVKEAVISLLVISYSQ